MRTTKSSFAFTLQYFIYSTYFFRHFEALPDIFFTNVQWIPVNRDRFLQPKNT